MLSDKRYQEIIGVASLCAGLLLLFALFSFSMTDRAQLAAHRPVHNFIGPAGAWIAWGVRFALGLSGYVLAALACFAGISIVKRGFSRDLLEKGSALLFIAITTASLFALLFSGNGFSAGGVVGSALTGFCTSLLGLLGATILIICLNITGCILLGIVSFATILDLVQRHKDLPGKAFSSITKRLLKPQEEKIPRNYIADDLAAGETQGKQKLPWITRKKIIVYEMDETAETPAAGLPIPYVKPAAPVPESVSVPVIKDPILIERGRHAAFFDKVEQAFGEEPAGSREDIVVMTLAEEEEEELHRILPREETAIVEPHPADDAGPLLVEGEPFEDEEEPVFHDEPVVEPRKKTPALSELPPDDAYASDNAEDAGSMEENEKEVSYIRERVFEDIPINCEYIIPTAYLNSSIPIDSESWRNEVLKNSKLLVNTLADFGIESRVINVNRGPVITLYELQIAAGIKVNRIVGLADDIAMALAAYRVRIIAPIPGKSAIGVEIPNRERETVTLGDIMKLDERMLKSGALIMALGKDTLGKPIMLDLKRQPHLLIAGSTGSGKSVCVNAIITSLIYNYNPNYVRFILIDPKMVELQLYNGLPHLLTPVITEPHVAPVAFKWLIYEMERRYRLLSDLATRDIDKYNDKVKGGKANHERLPYIVTIIDELADLMMTAPKEMEGYITRIAQKARAVGIHLVLATQRPSVDIITGVIKANFPARIAFQVAQKIDSRTIIDQNGADKLLGKGDMLYQSPTSSYPIRIQGAFISEEEIASIVRHLEKISKPHYIDIESYLFQIDEDEREGEDPKNDELFVEALKIVEETRKASASYLQRRLSIGYNRAARIIEMMEELGYVGPQQGSKPREVLI